MNSSIVQQIERTRIIPVVQINHAEHATPLAHALSAGGLPIAEITLRTDCAIAAINQLADRDSFLVGAGTVLNATQARDAINAGAKFIVSPGLDRGVVEFCQQQDVPVFPGVSTASEVQLAYNLELTHVKFFPAEAAGGIKMLQALSGPFHQMKFVPTGGINADNTNEYLNLPCVAAIGGSWMVKPSLYANGDFAKVEQLTREALSAIQPNAPKQR